MRDEREQRRQTVARVLGCQALEGLRPEVLATLLEQWLQTEPAYALGELVVLDPVAHGQRAYEATD